MKYSAMFHHFHDNFDYPELYGSGSISAIDFHLIIDYLDNCFNLLTPNEFTQKVKNNSIKELDLCLTFDDSLKCQFDIVYPELEKRKLKACFFVYSDAFSKNPPMLEFFRDFRLSCFRNVEEYYKSFFTIIKSKRIREYNIFLKHYKPDYLSNFSFYTDNDKKYRFIRDVILKDKYFDIVLSMMQDKNYSIADRQDYLFMSIDNLKKLDESGHTIGLHSHSHPTSMHRLSYTEQLEEYTNSYEFINSITHKKVSSMSHPCGNYNHETIKVLKKLGIDIGFRSSMFPSVIKSALEIPREDHANIINIIKKYENNSLHK